MRLVAVVLQVAAAFVPRLVLDLVTVAVLVGDRPVRYSSHNQRSARKTKVGNVCFELGGVRPLREAWGCDGYEDRDGYRAIRGRSEGKADVLGPRTCLSRLPGHMVL